MATGIGCPSSSYRSRTKAVAEQPWGFWKHVNKWPRPKQQCYQRERFRYRLQTSWRRSWRPAGKLLFLMSPTSINIPEKIRTDIEEEPLKGIPGLSCRVCFMTGFIKVSHRLRLTLKSIYPDMVVFRLGGLNIATFMSIKRVRGLEWKWSGRREGKRS